MAYIEQNVSFFEELEATAKRLSVASATNRSTSELKQLFDELKEMMVEENSLQIEPQRMR